MAVRSTQCGAGDMVVVMDHTMLHTGYGFPPSCTRVHCIRILPVRVASCHGDRMPAYAGMTFAWRRIYQTDSELRDSSAV